MKLVEVIRKFDGAALIVAIGILIMVVFAGPIGRITGAIWPVMGPLTISNVREAPPFVTRFDGEAIKLRDCIWEESRWYIGERDGPSVRTIWTFSGPPVVREKGGHGWTDMTVLMAARDLMNNSYADAVHDCGWPWLTITKFYDSEVP